VVTSATSGGNQPHQLEGECTDPTPVPADVVALGLDANLDGPSTSKNDDARAPLGTADDLPVTG
jgi:hypothetical protein